MTQVTTIDTSNYNAMAQVMGMGADAAQQGSKSSTLARLRINHSPIMGEQDMVARR